MAVLSVLRCANPALRLFQQAALKGKCGQIPKSGIVVRQMGSHRTIPIKPGKYQWTVFKDHLHFYFLLGVIPLGTLIVFTNLFIGQGELKEIPEGYRPHHWEYYKHPITRFFSRYVHTDFEISYESRLHYMNEDVQKRKYGDLEKKVREHMKRRADYKGWYYVPSEERKVYVERDFAEKLSGEMAGGTS